MKPDTIIECIAQFELLHGARPTDLRLNQRDYDALLASYPDHLSYFGHPTHFMGLNIHRDERFDQPAVSGVVYLPTEGSRRPTLAP